MGQYRSALIIDDDESNRTVLHLLLERNQYQVKLSDDGRSGLALLEQEKFDLAVIDMHLPDILGTEIVAQARPHHDNMYIIVATMDDDVDTIRAAFAAGCDAFIVKPYDFNQILELALQPQRGQQWFSDRYGLRPYKGSGVL